MSSRTLAFPVLRRISADADMLMGIWSYLIKIRDDHRGSLSYEQDKCLEFAAREIARFLNITEPRAFQQHLDELPEDFPLVM